MKRLPIAALSLALLLALALPTTGCGGGDGGAEPPSADGTPAGGSGSTAIATIDDLRAALERDHADAEWYPDITDITLETYLGAPVLTLHVPWTTATGDFEAQNRKQMAIVDALSAYDITVAPNHALITGDGTLHQLGGGGSNVLRMAEAFDLPPAPQTAEELAAWLETVYGPGGLVALGPDETWYGSLVSIEMGDFGSGANDVLMITTDAADDTATDVSLIVLALQTTGSPLVTNYSISTAGGGGVGGSAGLVGPGQAGWFYPAP